MMALRLKKIQFTTPILIDQVYINNTNVLVKL